MGSVAGRRVGAPDSLIRTSELYAHLVALSSAAARVEDIRSPISQQFH